VYWGACWSICEGRLNTLPWLGSGKAVTPCVRIQVANVRACARPGTPLAPPAVDAWPLGSNLRHACRAEVNAGEWPSALPEPRCVLMVACTPPPELENCGSGKFGTPCERMQTENATPCLTACARLGAPDEPGGAPLPQPDRSRPIAIGMAKSLLRWRNFMVMMARCARSSRAVLWA
jgi:hypothetical protein